MRVARGSAGTRSLQLEMQRELVTRRVGTVMPGAKRRSWVVGKRSKDSCWRALRMGTAWRLLLWREVAGLQDKLMAAPQLQRSRELEEKGSQAQKEAVQGTLKVAPRVTQEPAS